MPSWSRTGFGCGAVGERDDLRLVRFRHEANATHHDIKYGITMFGIAALALIGSWFTTAPREH
jgi:hypothetical protein